MICDYCPHGCEISETKSGFCKTKTVADGRIKSLSYGQVTSIALDPIEKKPLHRFFPGSKILSIGFWGCNMSCPWCQNDSISRGPADYYELSAEDVVKEALGQIRRGNIGIAYTYNEALTNYDYVLETAALAKKERLKNVLVTNGMLSEPYLSELLPDIDALNIDLKTFDEDNYRKIGGNLETVISTIRKAHETSHVEVTTLIVPGFNDTEEEILKIAEFLSEIDKDIPLHISRFFPAGNMKDRQPTSIELIYHLREVALNKLKYVYTGNC